MRRAGKVLRIEEVFTSFEMVRTAVDLLVGVDLRQVLVLLFEDGQVDDVIDVEDDAVLVDQVVLEPRARVNLKLSVICIGLRRTGKPLVNLPWSSWTK